MNFLAHLYLSDRSDEGLLGSLMGDFVKGPLGDRYPAAITRGIALHRKIDTFTDAHPIVLRSKARVSAGRRRYAGIMVDMFYDHFLSRDWRRYSDESLPGFSARVYQLLGERLESLPEGLRMIAPAMARMDWLGSYAQVGSIRAALDRMGRRLTRENRLLDSAEELIGNYEGFEADFLAFMPDVASFARSQDAAGRPEQATGT